MREKSWKETLNDGAKVVVWMCLVGWSVILGLGYFTKTLCN